MNTLSELYKTDFHAWTLKTASLIRRHQFDALNVEELAGELDSMGRKEQNEIANRLVILLAHLLKWQFQPACRSSGWRGSIIEQRKQIERQLRYSPSVRPHVADAVMEAYPDAVDLAVRETLLDSGHFPTLCPYSLEQIMSFDFYPECQ